MKLTIPNPQHLQMLAHINKIPRNMLLLPEHHNLAEFVLHDLCHPACFNITKAAYLVDNSDFDCLKGVSGFDAQERFGADDVWSCSADFTEYMKQAAYNKKVRTFEKKSGKFQLKPDAQMVSTIAHELEIPDAHYMLFPMKHDNTGLFIYQATAVPDERQMLNGLSMLSFCPLY